MYIDHDVLYDLLKPTEQFVFHPALDINDAYLFTFLRMLVELNQLPYELEVLQIETDDLYKIPTAQLYSRCPKAELEPILDRYGFLLRKAAGI